MSVYVCVCKQNHLDGKQHTGCIPIRETVLELKAMCVHVVCVCVRVRVCVCVYASKIIWMEHSALAAFSFVRLFLRSS